ncbi:hypothetical protein Plhal304r1_c023g0080701 [Plasmopara halstedii]
MLLRSIRRRQGMADKFADEVMKESEKRLKRKRAAALPNKSHMDNQATKSC